MASPLSCGGLNKWQKSSVPIWKGSLHLEPPHSNSSYWTYNNKYPETLAHLSSSWPLNRSTPQVINGALLLSPPPLPLSSPTQREKWAFLCCQCFDLWHLGVKVGSSHTYVGLCSWAQRCLTGNIWATGTPPYPPLVRTHQPHHYALRADCQSFRRLSFFSGTCVQVILLFTKEKLFFFNWNVVGFPVSDDMAHIAHISLCLDRKDELFLFSNQPFFCHHLPLSSPVCPCVSHLTGPQDAAVALAEARSDWLICVMSFT